MSHTALFNTVLPEQVLLNKAEEFEITQLSDGTFRCRSRITGCYRVIDMYAGSAVNGNKIILSVDTGNSKYRNKRNYAYDNVS